MTFEWMTRPGILVLCRSAHPHPLSPTSESLARANVAKRFCLFHGHTPETLWIHTLHGKPPSVRVLRRNTAR